MLKKIIPPPRWKVPVIILLGIFAGIGSYAFYISKAPSYLGNNPMACVNCHIMAPQYATWFHSGHRSVTNCNECHVPHHNLFTKYYFKAKDGMRHATVFTLRAEPQVIFIHQEGQHVVQQNCIRCHAILMTDPVLSTRTKSYDIFRQDRYCWDCHRETPHGRVNGLSSTPYASVLSPELTVPSWLKKIIAVKDNL